MRKLNVLLSVIIVLALLPLTMTGSALAASTTKALSTVYTVVNLGATDTIVNAQYYNTDGSDWTAADGFTSFPVGKDGGQAIMRQYDPASGMLPGQGSVVISSGEPLGAFVQILARNQTPTSGAYNGVTAGSNISYLPLLQKNNNTSSGLVRSQIIVQNTETTAQNPVILLRRTDGTTLQKDITNLQGGASYYYDLADESGLPNGWVGSATVTGSGGGTLAVVSNMFVGTDGLMTYNAFPSTAATSEWYMPLLTSRLSNGQSGVIVVQNLSGGQIPINDVQLTCTKDPDSQGAATLTVGNLTAIDDRNLYSFNPAQDATNFPTNWFGSCRVFSQTSKAFVAFGQIRYTNGVQFSAAYEGIPANLTTKTLYVPLVMKRLSNGQCTVATIQNLNKDVDANVTLIYTPSKEYVGGGGSANVITIPNITIPKGSSINRNYRMAVGAVSEPSLPIGWYGTLKVTSDQPVQAMVQISNLYWSGDTMMSHLGFVK